jgi:hypothetical protein
MKLKSNFEPNMKAFEFAKMCLNFVRTRLKSPPKEPANKFEVSKPGPEDILKRNCTTLGRHQKLFCCIPSHTYYGR